MATRDHFSCGNNFLQFFPPEHFWGTCTAVINHDIVWMYQALRQRARAYHKATATRQLQPWQLSPGFKYKRSADLWSLAISIKVLVSTNYLGGESWMKSFWWMTLQNQGMWLKFDHMKLHFLEKLIVHCGPVFSIPTRGTFPVSYRAAFLALLPESLSMRNARDWMFDLLQAK